MSDDPQVHDGAPKLAPEPEMDSTLAEPVVDPEVTQEMIVSSVANAIGWAMLSGDGREVRTDGSLSSDTHAVFDGGAEPFSIEVTFEESARCREAAERALLHLDVLRHPFEDLRRFQSQQFAWAGRNFPPADGPEHRPLLGIGEELAEVAEALQETLAFLEVFRHLGMLQRAQLKGEQGIRFTPEQVHQMKVDEVGDVIVYLANYCSRAGIDLADALNERWAEVSQRDWVTDPKRGGQDGGVPLMAGQAVQARHLTVYKDLFGGEMVQVYSAEAGHRGEITSVTDAGIFVVWDDDEAGLPRPVLHGDIEVIPVERIEPERPNVVHYTREGESLDEAPLPEGIEENP